MFKTFDQTEHAAELEKTLKEANGSFPMLTWLTVKSASQKNKTEISLAVLTTVAFINYKQSRIHIVIWKQRVCINSQ